MPPVESAQIVVSEHPPGMPHTRATVRKMAQLAREASHSYPIRALATRITHDVPSGQRRAELGALYRWVRDTVRYRLDPAGLEWVQSPARTVRERAGDCDDMATLLAGLAGSLGHPFRFVTVGPSSGVQKHIAMQASDGEQWVTLDPVLETPASSTQPRAELGAFGQEPPGAARLYWDAEGNMLSGPKRPGRSGALAGPVGPRGARLWAGGLGAPVSPELAAYLWPHQAQWPGAPHVVPQGRALTLYSSAVVPGPRTRFAPLPGALGALGASDAQRLGRAIAALKAQPGMTPEKAKAELTRRARAGEFGKFAKIAFSKPGFLDKVVAGIAPIVKAAVPVAAAFVPGAGPLLAPAAAALTYGPKVIKGAKALKRGDVRQAVEQGAAVARGAGASLPKLPAAARQGVSVVRGAGAATQRARAIAQKRAAGARRAAASKRAVAQRVMAARRAALQRTATQRNALQRSAPKPTGWNRPHPELAAKYPPNARMLYDKAAGKFRVYVPVGMSGHLGLRPTISFALGAAESDRVVMSPAEYAKHGITFARAAAEAVARHIRSRADKRPPGKPLPAVREFQSYDAERAGAGLTGKTLSVDGLWGSNTRAAAAFYLGKPASALPPVLPALSGPVTWQSPAPKPVVAKPVAKPAPKPVARPAPKPTAPSAPKTITVTPAGAKPPPPPGHVEVGEEDENPGLPPVGAPAPKPAPKPSAPSSPKVITVTPAGAKPPPPAPPKPVAAPPAPPPPKPVAAPPAPPAPPPPPPAAPRPVVTVAPTAPVATLPGGRPRVIDVDSPKRLPPPAPDEPAAPVLPAPPPALPAPPMAPGEPPSVPAPASAGSGDNTLLWLAAAIWLARRHA